MLKYHFQRKYFLILVEHSLNIQGKLFGKKYKIKTLIKHWDFRATVLLHRLSLCVGMELSGW